MSLLDAVRSTASLIGRQIDDFDRPAILTSADGAVRYIADKKVLYVQKGSDDVRNAEMETIKKWVSSLDRTVTVDNKLQVRLHKRA